MVSIEYACPEEAVGSGFELFVGDSSTDFNIEEAHNPDFLPSPDRVIRKEVYEKEWKRLVLGTFPMQKGKTTLGIKGKELMDATKFELKAAWVRKL